jgi:hypothetical protein
MLSTVAPTDAPARPAADSIAFIDSDVLTYLGAGAALDHLVSSQMERSFNDGKA